MIRNIYINFHNYLPNPLLQYLLHDITTLSQYQHDH